jgi:hypothetical protein
MNATDMYSFAVCTVAGRQAAGTLPGGGRADTPAGGGQADTSAAGGRYSAILICPRGGGGGHRGGPDVEAGGMHQQLAQHDAQCFPCSHFKCGCFGL